MEGILSPFRKNKQLLSLYGANLFLSFHFFLVIYIHSSFLETFFKTSIVSILFVLGSCLNILFFITAARCIRYIGALWYLLGAIGLEWFAIIVLSETTNPGVAALSFILHLSVVPMILFSLDVYLESINTNEKITGEIRGSYLTLSNITLVISPSIVALILHSFGFKEVFLISSLFLIPLSIITAKFLSKITVSPPEQKSFRQSIQVTLTNRNTTLSILLHGLLQFFYGWAVIYLPLYLIQHIGFNWTELGLLFSFMLLPFVLFEIPAGYLADKKIGEKEMIAFGFGCIAVTIAILAFPTQKIFWIWALLLFMTRVGAAIAEITIESYFFKHVNGKDSGIIGLFRMMRPIGFIIAPIIATLSLQLFSIRESFFILGGIMLLGSIGSIFLVDTLD